MSRTEFKKAYFSPNGSAILRQLLRGIPLIAIAPVNGLMPGLGGLQAAVGGIRHTGGQCEKIWGNIADDAVLRRMMAFLRGGRVASGLKGQVFGLYGGRSIGMISGTASQDVWLDQFGVDIDHVDQSEILRHAAIVPEAQTHKAMRAMLEHRGPVYLRLSRDVVGSLYGRDAKVEIGRVQKLADGSDVLIVVTGTLLGSAPGAAELLKTEGISACVVESICVKPLDEALIAREAVRCGRVVTLENVLGGLGDAVCAAVCAQNPVPILKLGVRDSFGESARSYHALLSKYGLDGESVAAAARQFVRR